MSHKPLALAAFGSLVALAFPLAFVRADSDQPRRPPHEPPQEAIDACASAKQGNACTVKLRDHTLTGTCERIPQTTTLACRPDHPPGPPPNRNGDGNGPPPPRDE